MVAKGTGSQVIRSRYPLEKRHRKNMRGMKLPQSRWRYSQKYEIEIIIVIQFFTFRLVWTDTVSLLTYSID